ncbi:MAG: pyridoxal phosphate-dependent aminotransferase family protein [Planctomycetes bacterium]|nr:pyridoxal phosphate-dependent aminotransferase family protein [Planctomycetota bacterium]
MPSASPTPATAASATRLVRGGRTLLSFAGTGYLGLAHHPAVLDAAREALARCGLSAGAARGTTGTFDEHEALEEELARFLGVEAVALAPDGWLADAAALEALAPEVDALLLDVDAHAALRAAARLVDLPRHDYAPHALDEARAWLDARGAHRPALLCDGVHPMAQRVAELPLLLELVGSRGALVVDDSHGLGVLGAHGRGTVEAFALRDARLVVTGSLAKALGAGGGFVAGDAELVARVRTSSAAYNTTTPVPPAVAAGARAALRVLADDPARLERLRANARRLDALAARAAGSRATPGRSPCSRCRSPTRSAGARRRRRSTRPVSWCPGRATAAARATCASP